MIDYTGFSFQRKWLTPSDLHDSSEDIDIIVALSKRPNRHNLFSVVAKSISKPYWQIGK